MLSCLELVLTSSELIRTKNWFSIVVLASILVTELKFRLHSYFASMPFRRHTSTWPLSESEAMYLLELSKIMLFVSGALSLKE